LKKKKEIQKENRAPMSFKESREIEAMKQKKINARTKKEEKDALCEVLGRGC